MAYANVGYVIAAAMLETVTKRPWEQLIRQHVFEPLRLHSGGIGLPGRKGRLDQPVGHRIDSEGKRIPHPVDLPAVLGPAGMTHLSLADLLRYLSAHRDQEARILRRENWEKLHTPPFGGNYALGWVVLPDGTLMHNGSNLSWYALAMFNRSKEFVAAFVANDASPLSEESRIYASMIAAGKA